MGKIARPHLPQVFPRRRLFGILDRMREHPLIYFSGPGGCGKTTLVNSYLEARNVPCLWYQIDEGDKDPATFFYYLSRAAKIASFKKKTFLPVFSPDFLPRLPVFTRWYFEKLFFSINHPPASPKNGEDHRDFILVFDNFHEVPANSLLPEIICEGLSQIPERTRFFILSRTDPPSSLSRLRANGQMKLIDWADLRLDLTETEEIIRLWNFRVESAEAVRRLHETSDGWIAGLILMLQKAQRARAAPELLEKLGREEIFDYFVGEIFRRADPAYQDFLLQTALFPRMTAAMAEEMTGLSSCEQILSTLCKNNFFTEKRLEKDPLYQYHPLFREFLISRIRKSFSLKNLRESTRRASSCLEKNGHFEDAIRLLLESKDFEIALPLVLKQAPVLNAQGRHLLLEEWVRAFPQEIQENQPWLLYWLGVCKYLPSLSLAKTYFEKAFVGFRRKNDIHGTLFAASRLLAAIEYEGLNYGWMQGPLAVLKKIARENGELPLPADEFLLSFSIFFAIFYSEPHNPEIESWLEKLSLNLENAPEPFLRAFSLSILTFYWMYLGDLPEASRVLLRLQEFLRSPEAPLISRIRSREPEVVYHILTGSLEAGLKAASESLDLCRTTGAPLTAAIRILGNKAFIQMTLRDLKGAKDSLEQMTPLLGIMNPVDISFYHIAKARLALFCDDPVGALFHAVFLKEGVTSSIVNIALPKTRDPSFTLHLDGRIFQTNGNFGLSPRLCSDLIKLTIEDVTPMTRSKGQYKLP